MKGGDIEKEIKQKRKQKRLKTRKSWRNEREGVKGMKKKAS